MIERSCRVLSVHVLGARMLRCFVALAFAALAGCATVEHADPRDPLEGMNRSIYAFNEAFDDAVAKPVATAYKSVMPDPVRGWVRNFFANIADLFIGLNSLLQGKPADAVTDWARFAFNTTIGIFGINDVATEFGIEKHDEDFGQTFGRWGVADGPYLVWPLLGSSTLRDTVGRVIDIKVDPVRRHRPTDPRTLMVLLRATSQRADLLDASRILEEAALDKYVFQRDAYLQRRRSQIYDGHAPRQTDARTPSQPVAESDTPRSAVPAEREPVPAAGGEPIPTAAPGHASEDGSVTLGAMPVRVFAVYPPRIPSNYDAVLAAGASQHHAALDR